MGGFGVACFDLQNEQQVKIKRTNRAYGGLSLEQSAVGLFVVFTK